MANLLQEHTGDALFRLESDTIGVADPELLDALLRARPANAEERPTFKPVRGRTVPRSDASTYMQAVGADVRTALKKPVDDTVDLTGIWPKVPHDYLHRLVFGDMQLRFRTLVDRRLELTPKLTWSAVTAGAALLGKPRKDTSMSSLANLVLSAESYDDRRYAMYLYRRVAAPVCFTVAALVTNAVWLGAPFREDVSNREIIWESLRLLPVSWNILRMASPEFGAVDRRIGDGDDVLLLPILSHRDPKLWDDPNEFIPERWRELDPESHPGYLPFGHSDERCWGRHMVLPLAERLLDVVRRDGLTVSPEQTVGRVELDGLLEIARVRVTRA
ncbi:cytochrome P450 [Streptomyces adustus]|nr:cytochrome P450 [Streptomyces adustus]